MASYPTPLLPLGEISDALGDWRDRPGPSYRRLARALADAVRRGSLQAGARLPSERALAAHLRVARNTVVAAYDELRADGFIETRRGSGSVIVRRVPGGRGPHAPMLSRLVGEASTTIDMALSAPHLAPDEIPSVDLSLRGVASLVAEHGYAPLGVHDLRTQVARTFQSRGLPTETEQIIVTNGGQGAISLIAQGLLRPGDRVLVEAPTYPAAIEVFSMAGAIVESVPGDHAGPLPREFAHALSVSPVRLVYLIPTLHNPTGRVMSEQRRREVARLTAQAGALVVEDEVLAPLVNGVQPPPISAFGNPNIMTVGSLSKTVWGGLRVGWVRAPTEVALRLGRIKAAIDLGASVVAQAVAVELLDRFDGIVDAQRRLANERMDVLCDALTQTLPCWEFDRPRGGYSLWVRLPRGSADDLVQVGLRRGVAIASGRAASPSGDFSAHVRLSAGPHPLMIREGVCRLGQAWEDLGAAEPRSGSPAVLA